MFLHVVLWQLQGYVLCFCLILSKVLPGEANSSWNWFVLNDGLLLYAVGVWLLSLTPTVLPPPFFPPGSLFLPPRIFLCMCDAFCNEGSLMWRRSRVSLVEWEVRNARQVRHSSVCWLKVLLSPVRPRSAILNANASLWSSAVSVFPQDPGFQSTFSSLVQVCFHVSACVMYIIYTLVYFPLSHFDSSETNSDISCSKPQPVWAADRHVSTKDQERNTLWFEALWRKKMGSVGREWARSLIWWIFLTQTGKKVSPAGGADMCVCPNKSVSPSSSAAVSNKRCKPRLQNGCGGRKITFSFPSVIYCFSGYLGGEKLHTFTSPLLQKEV